MPDNAAHAQARVDGHRRAIREHIEKYQRYRDTNDKRFALKTIANAQRQIARIRRTHRSIVSSHEDTWKSEHARDLARNADRFDRSD